LRIASTTLTASSSVWARVIWKVVEGFWLRNPEEAVNATI
jgi:hypothetical protein